jgi:hypothetical protein
MAVCETRADGLGLQALVQDEDKFEFGKDVCGVLVQYPATDGTIADYRVGSAAGRQGQLRLGLGPGTQSEGEGGGNRAAAVACGRQAAI